MQIIRPFTNLNKTYFMRFIMGGESSLDMLNTIPWNPDLVTFKNISLMLDTPADTVFALRCRTINQDTPIAYLYGKNGVYTVANKITYVITSNIPLASTMVFTLMEVNVTNTEVPISQDCTLTVSIEFYKMLYKDGNKPGYFTGW